MGSETPNPNATPTQAGVTVSSDQLPTSGTPHRDHSSPTSAFGPAPPPGASELGSEGSFLPCTFGRYELQAWVAEGGMGVVYQAHDPVLQRIVALKTIRSAILVRPAEIERFFTEARAAARLNHPNIIAIHDIGQHERQPYFTMAFVTGGTLSSRRADYLGQPDAAAALLVKVARAVQHAHSQDVLHRDLKPGNILLDERGEPLVSDFGLAKLLDSDSGLTEPGQRIGTPAYMAPEQASGDSDHVGARSDIWSLGVILYELLVGRRPFEGKGRDQLQRQICDTDPPRPSTVAEGLPTDLEAIVLKCLEKRPDERYASAGELADDLERWLRREPPLARLRSWPNRLWREWRRRRLGAWAGMGCLAVVCLMLALRGPEPERPAVPGAVTQAPKETAPPKPVEPDWRPFVEQLKRGESLTFIGPTGPSKRLEWRTEEGRKELVPIEAKTTLRLEALGSLLAELLPEVSAPKGFRLRGEVKHLRGDGGKVGLYFGRQMRPSPQGPEHWFWVLHIAEMGDRAGQAALGPMRYRERSEGILRQTFSGLQEKGNFPPTPPLAVPIWRPLVIEVSPAGIQTQAPVLLAWHIPRAEMPQKVKPLILVEGLSNKVEPGSILPNMNPYPNLDGSGGVGLFVSNGEAAFRNVTLEPLNK